MKFLLPFFVILLLPTTIKSQTHPLTKRIAKGEPISISLHPYSGEILFLRGNKIQYTMDVVLISLQWALTSKLVIELTKEFNRTDIKLSVGVNVVDSKQHVEIEEFQAFPSFKEMYDNIALVKLVKPLEASENIHPASLPSSLEWWKNCTPHTAVGRGSSGLLEKIFDPIRYVNVSLTECDKEKEVDSTLLCLDLNSSDLEICSSDAGMGVVCNGTLAAILQPVPEVDHCENVSFATNVAHYMTWISNVTGITVAFESSPIHPRMGDNFDYYDLINSNISEVNTTEEEDWTIDSGLRGVTVIFDGVTRTNCCGYSFIFFIFTLGYTCNFIIRI